MKKSVLTFSVTCFSLIVFLVGSLPAQELALSSTAERAPLNVAPSVPASSQRSQALWDILFNYDVSTPTGAAGYAGVCFVNNEYWVSKWASDTIAIFSSSGSFVRKVRVTGVTGIRSMTYDGSFIYAGTNTNVVRKITPNSVTPTLAASITFPAMTGSLTALTTTRYVTYDPTANAGAGGFWAGNFDTDIKQVSMTGTSLNSITATSHGLGSIYGIAYDSYTAGGPYLWAADQNGTAAVADLYQISIATGLQTGVVHNILSDVGLASTGGLAGGLYLYVPQPGVLTLVGCLQGSPNLVFGYDMNVFVGLNDPVADGKFLSVTPTAADSWINVKLDKQNNNEATIQIMDMTGKVVFDKNSRGINNYINVSNFSSGLYFVKVSYGSQSYSTRFVKNQ